MRRAAAAFIVLDDWKWEQPPLDDKTVREFMQGITRGSERLGAHAERSDARLVEEALARSRR